MTTSTMPLMTIRSLLAFAAMFAGAMSAHAEWPEKPVRILTQFPAGTAADFAARQFAERLASRWQRPVIVENRPGGDGIPAINALLAARDNHTILFSNSGPMVVNPINHRELPYDPTRDVVPISGGTDVFVAMSVPASLKVSTLAEFVALAKSQPGKLNWAATPGILDYAVPGFLHKSGLELVQVSYRELAPAMQDLSEGRIHLYVAALASVMPQLAGGKIKVIAVTNRERAPSLPDVPTAAQAGYADMAVDGFVAFFAPKGMPPELRERIAGDIRLVGAEPSLASRLSTTGQVVRTSGAADVAQTLQVQRAQAESLVKLVGAKPQR